MYKNGVREINSVKDASFRKRLLILWKKEVLSTIENSSYNNEKYASAITHLKCCIAAKHKQVINNESVL
jgi:hypothetical protein